MSSMSISDSTTRLPVSRVSARASRSWSRCEQVGDAEQQRPALGRRDARPGAVVERGPRRRDGALGVRSDPPRRPRPRACRRPDSGSRGGRRRRRPSTLRRCRAAPRGAPPRFRHPDASIRAPPADDDVTFGAAGKPCDIDRPAGRPGAVSRRGGCPTIRRTPATAAGRRIRGTHGAQAVGPDGGCDGRCGDRPARRGVLERATPPPAPQHLVEFSATGRPGDGVRPLRDGGPARQHQDVTFSGLPFQLSLPVGLARHRSCRCRWSACRRTPGSRAGSPSTARWSPPRP